MSGRASCTSVLYNASSADPDAIHLPEITPASLRPLGLEVGGSVGACTARTSAGLALRDSNQRDGGCFDLGVSNVDNRWRQLRYLPELFTWMPRRAPTMQAIKAAERLQHELSWAQARGSCGQRPAYTAAELPMIGFCAVIEHGMLQLARAASSRSRLVLGRKSSPVWSSRWLCGRERSLQCYFNISADCCPDERSFEAALAAEGGGAFSAAGGKPAGAKPLSSAGRLRRRMTKGRSKAVPGGVPGGDRASYGYSRALSLGGALAPYNAYGSLWVSGQLIRWLFLRMHPHIRSEVDRRRASVLPRPPPLASTVHAAKAASKEGSKARTLPYRELCIGMHVRRGDSCSLGSRFCPPNRTAAYFGAAAALRDRYLINKLVVATDDAEAAALCMAGAYGFDCRTRVMDRERFNARTSIERRVAHHASGGLSGSAVALDTLADVEMLSDCEAHVLVLRSAVSRLALGLSVARKGRFAPLVSLQWPWGGLPGPSPLPS
jgi:hypothetical protein